LVSCFCRPTGKHCLPKWERRDSQVWMFSEVLRRLLRRVSCMTVQDCKAMRNSPWPLGHKRQESATVQAGRNMSARQSTLHIRYAAPSKFSRRRLTCGHKRPESYTTVYHPRLYLSIQKQQVHWNTEYRFGWEIQELISSRVTKEFRDHSVIMQTRLPGRILLSMATTCHFAGLSPIVQASQTETIYRQVFLRKGL
jgi:hypothetical protein